MKSLSGFFKQMILPVVITILAFCSIPELQAQEDHFTFEINIIETSSQNGKIATILISVDKKDTQYEYLLYNKEPWNGGKLIDKITSTEQKAEFPNITSGKYYVCVKNSTKAAQCKDISIE